MYERLMSNVKVIIIATCLIRSDIIGYYLGIKLGIGKISWHNVKLLKNSCLHFQNLFCTWNFVDSYNIEWKKCVECVVKYYGTRICTMYNYINNIIDEYCICLKVLTVLTIMKTENLNNKQLMLRSHV